MATRFYVVSVRRVIAFSCALVILGALAIVTAAGNRFIPHPLAGWLIALDAGHGGVDKGAWFPADGLVEKDINLDMARRLGEDLVSKGAAVVLVRDDDTLVQLGERARIANTVNARMFISLHVNRYPQDSRCCGAQVFFQKGSAEGERLAKLIQEQIRAENPENKRVALPADYKVLRESKMPSALVEIGFATNPNDRQLILDPAYRRDMTRLIGRAIVDYAVSRRQTQAIENRN